MYCILVTGIPAAGKSTMAEQLSQRFDIPCISKDSIKEIMFDTIGFRSREEKVKLGVSSMEIMYYTAAQMMKHKKPFILENNFENSSRDGLKQLLDKYQYKAISVVLTGDYEVIYQRFIKRDNSVYRHRGHVVNDCYPEKEKKDMVPLSYPDYVDKIIKRGMDQFFISDANIVVDTTDFEKIDLEDIIKQIRNYQSEE
ncbi:MAG: ATP-binding protein [Lachnospiraceae bacterium]|nr:ATP-binding protein [Lachnospiraceae bacterium]